MGAADRPPQSDQEPDRADEGVEVRDPDEAAVGKLSDWRLTLLSFVQFEYPGRIGLADGRYLAREDEDRVLIVQTLGVAHPGRRSRRRAGRKAKPIDSPAHPETVPVSRVTVARSTPFDDDSEAAAWLKTTAGDPKRRAAEAAEALELINRALDALRRAAEDPHVHDATLTRALAIRIGYGTGDQLADGHWTEARQLPDPPSPRHLELDPQKAVADELGGRKGDRDR